MKLTVKREENPKYNVTFEGLSMRQVWFLRELFGAVSGGGEAREFFDEVFNETDLSDFPELPSWQYASLFEGIVCLADEWDDKIAEQVEEALDDAD